MIVNDVESAQDLYVNIAYRVYTRNSLDEVGFFIHSGEYLDFLIDLLYSWLSNFPTGRWKKANSSMDGAYEPVAYMKKNKRANLLENQYSEHRIKNHISSSEFLAYT